MSAPQELLRNHREPVLAPQKAEGWWDAMLALRGGRGQGDPGEGGSQLGSAVHKRFAFTTEQGSWGAPAHPRVNERCVIAGYSLFSEHLDEAELHNKL